MAGETPSVRPGPKPNRWPGLLQNLHRCYLFVVAAIGLVLLLTGLLAVPAYQPAESFVLLLLLAIISSFAITAVPELSFEIASAIGVASIPLYGPYGAVVVVASGTAATWLLRRRTATSKGTVEQLVFNMGMQSISVGLAAVVYVWLEPSISAWSPLFITLLWLLVAIVHDQTNFWLLAFIIRLKAGPGFSPIHLWQENRWAMSMNIFLIWLGGGLIAFSAVRFGWSGIAAYFVPVILSAYAFKLYVRKMQDHMDNLEQIIAERTDELKQLMKEKDAFLAVLTHDMKTPLTSIGLSAQMLEMRPDILEKKPHIVKVIIRSQKTLLGIVNNILDIEKLQTGGDMELSQNYLQLPPLIDGIVESLQALAGEKEICLSAVHQNEDLELFADKSQLERAIVNLISNGIKYSPIGSTVTVRLTRADDTVQIAVVDSGYGIPEAELPFIFDSYRRVEMHKDKASGTGLGLSVVKAISEAHGGSVVVESVEGEGSEFTITLPLAVRSEAERLVQEPAVSI